MGGGGVLVLFNEIHSQFSHNVTVKKEEELLLNSRYQTVKNYVSTLAYHKT